MASKAYSTAKEKGADGALFLDGVNRMYLTGFRSTEGAVLCTEEETALFLDMRYALAAENKGLEGVKVVRSASVLTADVYAYAKARDVKRLIIESTAVTLHGLETLKKAMPDIELVPVTDICGEARQIKTKAELASIEKAQSITDACFSHVLGFIREGMRECDVAAEMEYFMKKHGADGLAFDTIAVSGLKSALPHGTPDGSLLVKNGFFTMDFGASYGGYCSDMTRTVVIGKATEEMRRVYNTVLEAQERAIAAIGDGVACKTVDAAARDYIAEQGYGQYFTHSTGHSLGLEIHEAPACSPKSKAVLKTGMLMTVEPGIYIEGFGGVRIEDMVVVTDGGCKNLTRSPKQLIEI